MHSLKDYGPKAIVGTLYHDKLQKVNSDKDRVYKQRISSLHEERKKETTAGKMAWLAPET